jgi:queuine tRNA-ribosyltransferase
MMLDECLAYPATHEAAEASMQRTVSWAQRGWAHYQRREKGLGCALFPIVQGSMYPDLRRACVEQLLKLNAPGYAIGGLSVGEPRELSQEITAVTAPLLPEDKPRYTMGVGMPGELPEYVAKGIDMMDCVLPSRNARNGCLFTSHGRVVIKQALYAEDQSPIDPDCGCYTCATYTRAYLRHLFLAGEILYSTLATLHNIHYYLDIMRKIRQSILLGNFPEFLAASRSISVAAD